MTAKTLPQRLTQAAALARKYRTLAGKHDGISPDSEFAAFSRTNPYAPKAKLAENVFLGICADIQQHWAERFKQRVGGRVMQSTAWVNADAGQMRIGG